jgi:hypothetical protein
MEISEMNKPDEEGDSTLYAGWGYIGIILRQIDKIVIATNDAYERRGLFCMGWLNQLRQLYPLIKNQTDIKDSKDEQDFEEIYFLNGKMETRKIKIKKSEKYIKWFSQIEGMIERNTQVNTIPGISVYTQSNYLNDKKILDALSLCETELLTDANSRHLLMPEGRRNMKELVKQEWVDRAKKKVF